MTGENYNKVKENFGDAQFELSQGGRITKGTFDEVFHGFTFIVQHAECVYTPITFSHNIVVVRFNYHLTFKDGCKAMFEGVGVDHYDDSGKLTRSDGYVDDDHSVEFNACIAQNMKKLEL